MRPTLRLALPVAAAIFAFASSASAAPVPPHGAHPRMFLTPDVLTAMKTKVSDPKSGVGLSIAMCQQIAAGSQDYKANDNWGWSFGAPACALAWKLTGDAAHAAAGLKMWNALLDDYNTLGDGAGGDDVVTHDSGYELRTHAYLALTYDWMFDAPGVDDALKQKTRARFKVWIDWGNASAYLNDTPGSNYHAGFVFAKTLVAIAAAGEDGTTSDTYWKDVNDTSFAAQIIAKGLAPTGPLTGGDWPEGWQYGSLSVLEYALSARALEEHGAMLPQMHTWASDVAVNYVYTVPPAKNGVFTDGDLDNDQPVATMSPRTLLATISGLGSDQAAAVSADFLQNVIKQPDQQAPIFNALAEARAVTPASFESMKPPLYYVAAGTRKIYARSAWTPDAVWGYFTAAPRLVPDHQHDDASSFVLVRGADWIVADPSPYGSLSSLTGNALTVDSNVIDPKAKPSQSIWENASELVWARGVSSGIAAARANLSGAFEGTNGKATDVPFARREWVFLPEGDVVIVDRARTDDPARHLHVRLRTQATLALAGNAASGTVGASKVTLTAVQLSGGMPKVRAVAGGGTCDNAPTWGVCDTARFAVNEYSVDVPGPTALAIHVASGTASADAAPTAVPMNDPTVQAKAGQNDGVIGAAVKRGTTETFVVASSAKDGAAGATMTYGVPGDAASRHVVYDAPEDAMGKSNVVGSVVDGKCVVTITAGGSFAGHPLVFGLGSAGSGCTVNEDKPVPPGGVPGGGGNPGNNDHGTDPTANGSGGGGGCGCYAAGSDETRWGALGALGAAVAVVFARRRRRM